MELDFKEKTMKLNILAIILSAACGFGGGLLVMVIKEKEKPPVKKSRFFEPPDVKLGDGMRF
jgi:hypothetical protein